MKPNGWATQYAFKRRAIDRKLLAECERNLPDMLLEASPGRPGGPKLFSSPSQRAEAEAARAAIARAFGRPVQ